MLWVVGVLGVKDFKIICINMGDIGGFVLMDSNIVVFELLIEGILVIYVFVCNIVFLFLVLGWVEVLDVDVIFIGVNVVDYFGYLDCCFEFIVVFEYLFNVVIKKGVEGRFLIIKVFLFILLKGEIICKGIEFGVDYSLMVLCY